MIGTSIYISNDRLQLLRKTSHNLNINESDLLSLLLRKSRKLFGNKAIIGHAVKYQKTDESGYVIHHIILNNSDYEFATGRRYLFKISVSFIFALVISRFIDEIVYEWTHNRPVENKAWKKYKTNKNYKYFSIGHYEDISSETWQIPWPRE